jgi:hypothetical protein
MLLKSGHEQFSINQCFIMQLKSHIMDGTVEVQSIRKALPCSAKRKLSAEITLILHYLPLR